MRIKSGRRREKLGKIGLRKLNGFIDKDLKKKIQSDLQNHLIFRESDIECCVYHHLRRFLHGDGKWRVVTRRYSRRAGGKYPDILIFRKEKPLIAIELKWGRKRISRTDRKKLRKYQKKISAKKTFFVNVHYDLFHYKKLKKKTRNEKFHLKEIIVDLGYPRKEYSKWRKEHDKYKKSL